MEEHSYPVGNGAAIEDSLTTYNKKPLMNALRGHYIKRESLHRTMQMETQKSGIKSGAHRSACKRCGKERTDAA